MLKIGDTVTLTQEHKTPGGKKLNTGSKGVIVATDNENCMVRFDLLTAWLIVPKNKLEVDK